MTSTAEIGNLRVRLGIDSAEFANGVRSVQGSLSTLSSSLKTFATGAAAITLFNSAVSALKDVADLGDVAESIGLSAEQLQVFNRLALASGTSTDVMTRGLQSIAEQSTDANSKLSQLFTANGLTMAGKEMNQIILEFMTLLQNAKSPAEQLAIATDVLGTKVGRNLVEALRTGSSGWQEEFGNMRASGNYLADESVKDAQRIETAYNQATANIATVWQRMIVNMLQGAQNLAAALDPIINPDMSKGTAFGELWNLISGNKVDWGYGSSPGFGGKLIQPETVNMGPMGGPGQFQSIPAKVTVLPLDSTEKKKITKEVQAAVDSGMYIPPDTIDSIYGAGDAFQTLWDNMAAGIPTADGLTSSFQRMEETIADGLSTALVGLISGTQSVTEAFQSMMQSISQMLEQIAKELMSSAIMSFLQYLPGMLAGGGGAGLNIGGMVFGGLFANGGHLGAGQWGIAGENGPEIIHGPANITPMDGMGGSAPQMNVTVINNSAAQVATRQAADGGLDVIIEDKIAAAFARGGNKIDSAIQKGYGLRRAGR